MIFSNFADSFFQLEAVPGYFNQSEDSLQKAYYRISVLFGAFVYFPTQYFEHTVNTKYAGFRAKFYAPKSLVIR